jgi:NAD(P)-dependent dehydrogenase (short-subunit alcohol dehydrogenase family)
MVEYAVSEFGRVDILVCNAGIWNEAAIEDMTDTILDEMIDANLKGCFYCAGAAVPHMKKQKSGIYFFIINGRSEGRGLSFTLRGDKRGVDIAY